ncbi:MAG: MurR/RpiR family transcriptional regulator [Rhizobiales bacterium]|nr:MurR/RpiR family transcriptional regulator [Hyphomicrobiales bacterium]
MADLTPSERKAAQALVASYPMLGLETVSRFAGQAGVSAPTILRFVARLGFASYAAFQRRLMAEVEARLLSPLAKADAGAAKARHPRAGFADAVAGNVAETFRRLPAGEFEAVATLLADPRRPLHLLGGRFTDALALYMTAHLRILRPTVGHLAGQRANWRDQLLDMGSRDVLFLIDIRRYQDDLVELAAAAAKRRVVVVLLTDQWLSPVARHARHVLPARVAAPSAWDSSVALLALIEALVADVTSRRGAEGRARMAAIEALRDSPPS